MRVGAVWSARRAHNSKAVGSNPTPATILVMFKILSICKGGGYHYCRTEPPHPKRNSKGLYPLHRVMKEIELGRLLSPEELVHHRNEDKDDDSIENLEALTRSAHSKLHGDNKTKMVDLVCAKCGTDFQIKEHTYRLRLKRLTTQSGLCCSRSCSVSLLRQRSP